jgi:GNAT superfamily N-acetyltransferase
MLLPNPAPPVPWKKEDCLRRAARFCFRHGRQPNQAKPQFHPLRVSHLLGRSAMLRFFHRLFRSSHPLDAENLGDRTKDITFRMMEDADIPTCLALYRANEAAHFPPGRFEHYEAKLRGREFLTLLAIRDAKPVGCCGIHYTTSTEGIPVGVLCFGMVDPAHQRQGIGTAQVLVRLAQLTAIDDLAIAAMFAVPSSVSFYTRFGFEFDREARGGDGGIYPFGLLKATQSFIDDCRSELKQRHINYPDVKDQIPRQKAA